MRLIEEQEATEVLQRAIKSQKGCTFVTIGDKWTLDAAYTITQQTKQIEKLTKQRGLYYRIKNYLSKNSSSR